MRAVETPWRWRADAPNGRTLSEAAEMLVADSDTWAPGEVNVSPSRATHLLKSPHSTHQNLNRENTSYRNLIASITRKSDSLPHSLKNLTNYSCFFFQNRSAIIGQYSEIKLCVTTSQEKY